MEVYMNTTCLPEERAQDLVSKMSLDEKMAQIAGMITGPVLTEEAAEKFRINCPHGIGQISGLTMGQFRDVKDARKMLRILQKVVMEQSEHHIPAIFHMEGLCGPMLVGATSFPSGIGRGASFDPELEELIGEIKKSSVDWTSRKPGKSLFWRLQYDGRCGDGDCGSEQSGRTCLREK